MTYFKSFTNGPKIAPVKTLLVLQMKDGHSETRLVVELLRKNLREWRYDFGNACYMFFTE